MKKFLLSAAAVAIMTGAAYAQTGFYVVQDTSTKKCTVVDKRPVTFNLRYYHEYNFENRIHGDSTTASATIRF